MEAFEASGQSKVLKPKLGPLKLRGFDYSNCLGSHMLVGYREDYEVFLVEVNGVKHCNITQELFEDLYELMS
jgi:hypothetical protein